MQVKRVLKCAADQVAVFGSDDMQRRADPSARRNPVSKQDTRKPKKHHTHITSQPTHDACNSKHHTLR